MGINNVNSAEPIYIFNETVAGVTFKEFEKQIYAGKYLFRLKNVSSTDTDTDVSVIDFYNDNVKIKSLSVYRGVPSQGTFTLDSEVNRVIFYASDNFNNSENDTFIYTDFQFYISSDADFEPDIPDSEIKPDAPIYKPMGAFRFWCQKVLPTVYDDSLSYYELLTKVVHFLNEMNENIDSFKKSLDDNYKAFEDLQKFVNLTKDSLVNSYSELQSYVNTYFENLDVQTEINNKLDTMSTNGTLSLLVAPFIPELVTNWLNENVVPGGSTIVVDETLSISGAAADAKKCGELKQGINASKNSIINGSAYYFMNETVSGTGYKQIDINLEAGKYEYDLTSVASSDTDSTASKITFFNGNTGVLDLTFYRGQPYHGKINLSNSVDKIIFYASDTFNHSTGDTFTYNGFAFGKPNKNSEDIEIIKNSIINGVGFTKVNGNFSGTGYVELPVNIEAGTYDFSVQDVTSNDTDSTVSVVDFYNGSTKIKGLSFYRGESNRGTFTLNSDVNKIYFYASDNYQHSVNDTFSFSEFNVSIPNKNADDIYALTARTNNVANSILNIDNSFDTPIKDITPTWIHHSVNDVSGAISAYEELQNACTQEIINVLGYSTLHVVTGVDGLSGVKIYKYDIDGRYLGYNWGTSIIEFSYSIPTNVAGIRIGYSKETTIDLSTIGNISLSIGYVPKATNLYGKKIAYDGDSIAESRLTTLANGGAYAKLIAEITKGSYTNQAASGGHLSSTLNNPYYGDSSVHSVVDNITNLPTDYDLYCFEGGINDYWANIPLGNVSDDYTSAVDINTVAGALEYIFRYSLNHFIGKPIVFVIVHKVQTTFITENSVGDTFKDYHDMFVRVCNKYSIPYYDAYNYSGLNGWNTIQSNNFLNAGASGADGTHPNKEGYLRYYVPQLIDIFSSVMKY